MHLFNPHLILMCFLTFTVLCFSSAVKDQDAIRPSESSDISSRDSIIYGNKLVETIAKEQLRLKKKYNKYRTIKRII